MAQPPRVPPPNPYGTPDPGALSFTLAWNGGQHTLREGSSVQAGRDPARCPIVLTEPRVSAVHATLKVEGSQIWIRDEGSNNGTFVGGGRIGAGLWTPIPRGAPLRIGPVDIDVHVEGR